MHRVKWILAVFFLALGPPVEAQNLAVGCGDSIANAEMLAEFADRFTSLPVNAETLARLRTTCECTC